MAAAEASTSDSACTDADDRVDLRALSAAMNKKFEAHDAMLKTVIESQQQLLRAVQQLQMQQSNQTQPAQAMP